MITDSSPQDSSNQDPVKKKIWFKDKTVELSRVVEEYNAGEDILYDQQMIPDDVWCSRCYARMLRKHDLLTDDELAQLERGLDEILELYEKGEFVLKVEDEDCHTKIEDYLIERLGDAGKKIHTGRSRNDQVLVMMRFFLKRKASEIREKALNLAGQFTEFAKEHEMVPMPGYTHMQKAMPTTVGSWMGSFAESLLDDVRLLNTITDTIVDQNPLGSGAGYGSPFDFDRDWLSKEIGFSKTQNNVIYCHNSRGKIEGLVLEACCNIMLTLNRLACDLLFFTTQEFQFFNIDDSIATGSSIMPQKKNLDVAELIRGRTPAVLACRNEMSMNIMNKISGYHRDGQEIKRPLFLGLKYTEMSLDAMGATIANITPNKQVLLKSMFDCPGLFAAHKAFEKVKEGMTFRDAYREVGSNIAGIQVTEADIDRWLKLSTHEGGTGNLRLDKIEEEINTLAEGVDDNPRKTEVTLSAPEVVSKSEDVNRWDMLGLLRERIAEKGGAVCCHAHFDKAYVITPETLQQCNEHMEVKWDLWKSVKEGYTTDNLEERIMLSAQNMISQGVKHARTNIDVDSTVGLMCIEAALKVKDKVKDKLDLTICSQVLEGAMEPRAREFIEKAAPMVDVLGGLPSRDRPNQGAHLDYIFEMAKKYGKTVDVHIDQNNDPDERDTELLARKVIEHGLHGRVNAVHSCSLAAHPDAYIKEVCKLVKEADMSVIVCPRAMIDNQQPRHKFAPVHNSIAPISHLLDAGVNIALGVDNVHDFFCPFIDGDMFTELVFLLEASRVYDVNTLVDIATVNGRKALGIGQDAPSEKKVTLRRVLQGKFFGQEAAQEEAQV